jgi:hypothetical protein
MLKPIYDRISVFGRGEWPAVAFAIALIILIGWAALAGVGDLYRSRSNFGFGPEWNCTYVGNGEPVCVKQPAKPAAR